MRHVHLSGFTLVLVPLLAYAQTEQQTYQGLGAGSVSRELVAKYAPPPPDPQVSRRIQSMLDVSAPGQGIVAPDGSRLYFSWRITGTQQIFRLDAPLGFPRQLTGGEDRTNVEAVTPDGKWLVVSRDEGGQENPGLYLQSTEGGSLKTVQKIANVRTLFDFVSDDSRQLYFHSNELAPDSYAIYRYELATGTRTLVFSDKGLWRVADHTSAGGQLRLLLAKATGSFAQEYVEFEPATGRRTPLLGAGEQTEYDAAYAAHLGELLVLTNRFSDFRRLYRWQVGSDTKPESFHEVLAPRSMDVAGFSIDRARWHIYASLNDGGYTRLAVLDAQTFATLDLPLPRQAEQVRAGESSRDGRFVTIGIESAQSPPVSYVWDWREGKLTQWLLPSAPEFDLSTFVAPKQMSYPASDGTPIPMFARFPAGCAPDENPSQDPCPVVVQFHGGPESQARPGFSPRAQLFVEAGFVFVEPNVRGSDGYGKAWLEADNGPKRLDVIGDIDDAGKWIRAHWGRNGKAPRIGVMGGSYGGYSTLVAMTMFAGTYDAGAESVGMSNLETFLRNTAAYRRSLRASKYGDPDKDAEALRKLSPINYLDRVQGPLLLIQGVNDPRVPVGEAIQIHDALAARGIAAPLILFPDEGHGAAKRGNIALTLGYMIHFFEEKLKTPAGH